LKLKFIEQHARKIVNVHKHVDGAWFWDRYSAHPYIGCRFGCEFCYSRGGNYLGKRDPATFDTHITVKLNAVDRLRMELSRLPVDVVAVGDWQVPAEERFKLSRGMLKVVRDLKFPLIVIERSPLVTRDLDLLKQINEQSWACVSFSLSSLDPALKMAFEPRSPSVESRLEAMSVVADAGIQTGTNLMPILPFVGDDKAHLEEVVKATRTHGGSFVLSGGLTMAGVQAERSLAAACKLDPAMDDKWRELYQWRTDGKPGYGPPSGYATRQGRMVKELCELHGLAHRIPRYIPPGPFGINKLIGEKLFLATFDLELEQTHQQRIWAYRKAAWTIDELEHPVDELYKKDGEEGLTRLPGIGKAMAGKIARWLDELT